MRSDTAHSMILDIERRKDRISEWQREIASREQNIFIEQQYIAAIEQYLGVGQIPACEVRQ